MSDSSRGEKTIGTTRRLFLQLAAATGVVAGFSNTAFAQVSEIELDGAAEGWVGRSPKDIVGSENPTIRLEPGETYTLTWTNTDGDSHNIVIADGDGNTLERTEIVDEEGASQSLEFEATEEMSTYYCEVHPESMRGEIETGQQEAESVDEPLVAEVFSAGEMTGGQGPEPVETNASGATVFGLGEDSEELYYTLVVAGIEDITQAHIHLGAEDEEGDVVAWLFGQQDEQGAFVGPFERGISGSGVFAEGTITADDLVGPLEGQSFEELLDELRGETAYVNVHTEQHPGGELRGQIDSVEAVTVELTGQMNATVGETLQLDTPVTLEVTESGVDEPDSDEEEQDAEPDEDEDTADEDENGGGY